jgi:hypothetical protein
MRAAVAVASVLMLSAPARGQPDLSDVEYLSQSGEYQVWIDGQEEFVYESTKNGNHGTHNITSMSFVGFDLKGAATIEVQPKATVSRFAIRPIQRALRAFWKATESSSRWIDPGSSPL